MHPFIVWCEEEWDERARDGLILSTFNNNNNSLNFSSCFDNGELQQKLRVCSSGIFERNFRIGFLIAVILTNCISLAASYRLNWLTDYVKFFFATKSVHRSAIFALVKSNLNEDKEVFEEMMLTGGNKDAVNRQNCAGKAPLTGPVFLSYA